MADTPSRRCVECQGAMSPVVIMDKAHGNWPQTLEYRRAGDKQSFWTGKYRSAGPVFALICDDCGRIALYGGETPA